MKRKILSLILAFTMTVSLLTVGTGAVEPTYGDTAGHWAESSIERWSAYGIIQGSNGQFDPNGQLTCAQLATILAKLLKLPAAKDAGFTDNTADAWYYDAINRCAAAGILNGNGDGTVTPEAPITRERAMVMLARALGIEPIRKPDLAKYTDAAQVSAYAQGYLAAMIKAGIVGGVGDNRLAPQDNITRASTVTILDRAIGVYADKDGMTVNAKDGELVLVVAKNVKVINAPEGTKIVVADDATGLTVNGKAVSDDQTYIVPKTTSSGSSSGGYSHSHSYDATSHKCSCGEFAPDVVATIGDTNGYLTLKAAVAAATNGATVKLVKGALLDADILISSKITLDLNGNTIETNGKKISVAGTGDLTVTGNGIVNNQVDADEAGGTMNRYTMLSVKEGGKLTIENGTFTTKAAQIVYTYGSTTIRGGTFKNTSTSEETVDALNSGALIVVCGTPASLTMTGGTVTTESQYLYGVFVQDGGNAIFGDEETKNGPSIHTHRYAAIGENNTMPTANITIYGGEYTVSTVPASDAWKPFCATIYASASGEINIHGGTFTGYYAISDRYQKVEQTVTITGGTFNGAEADLYVTSEGGKGTTANRIIAIAGGTFDHNPDATYIATGYVAKDNNNGTWTVSEKTNVTLVAQVGVNKYETLADALAAAKNGDTVTVLDDVTTEMLTIPADKTLTLNTNGKSITNNSGNYAINNLGTLTIQGGGKIIRENAGNSAIRTIGALTLENVEVKVNDGMIAVKVDENGVGTKGTLIVNDGTVLTAESGQAIQAWGDVTINDGTLNGEVAAWSVKNWNPGNITIKGGQINGDVTAYQRLKDGNYPDQSAKIAIEGGNITGELKLRYVEFNSTITDCDAEQFTVKGSITVTGGTFSSDPSKYLAVGYKATEGESANTWTVEKMDGYAMIEGLDGWYETLTDAAKAWRESNGVVTSGNTFGANSLGTVDSITWTISGVVATGDGEGVIGNNGAGQSILGGGYYTPAVTVNNITIKGVNGAKITKTGDSYLVSTNGGNVVYENITFVDTVRIDSNPAKLTFKNCTFEAGFRMPHSAANGEVTIENCTFTGNESDGYAIFAQGSMASFEVTGSKISNCRRGINVQAGSSAVVTISNNTIKNITGVTKNNFTYGAAIQMTSAKTFTVTGNTISDVAVNALHIYNGCAAESIEVKNNNISAAYLCWNEANYTNVTSSGNTLNISNAGKCITKTAEIDSTFALN